MVGNVLCYVQSRPGRDLRSFPLYKMILAAQLRPFTWKAVSDSLLDITVAYWGGMMTYQIRIVSLGAEELSIRYLYTENRTDSR